MPDSPTTLTTCETKVRRCFAYPWNFTTSPPGVNIQDCTHLGLVLSQKNTKHREGYTHFASEELQYFLAARTRRFEETFCDAIKG